MNSAIESHAVVPRYGLLPLFLVILTACTSGKTTMDTAKLNEFGTQYTAAWCSQKAASVAAFFAEQGSLKVNDGNPAVGRAAITAVAQGFMSAFPDLADQDG